jgi:polyisoprenoid-binding protein YceI
MRYQFAIIICALSLVACNENVEELPVTELVETVHEQVEWKSFIGQDWLIDDQHSYLGFKINYFGFSPVRGRFDSFDGTLFYHSDYPNQLTVRVSIPVTSINTGQERRDQDLINEESWFNGIEHPFLDFESKEVIIRGDGSFDLVGELHMNGIRLMDTIAFAKPTSITKDWAGNDQVDFSGKLTLNRQDYNVRGGDFWSTVMENGLTQLSDLVEIELDMHCRRADYKIRYADALEDDLDKVLLDQIDAEGIDETLRRMSMLFSYQELSSGVMNSVGNTLNMRGKHEEALAVFLKKQEFFPLKHTTLNQLGITYLFLERREEASRCFLDLLEEQPTNSRALQYQSLINQLALD